MQFSLILFTFQGDSIANGGASNYLCATITGLGASQVGTFLCKPAATGRYVYIRHSHRSIDVAVCEVEVYSSYLSSKFALNNYVAIIIIVGRGPRTNRWLEVTQTPSQTKKKLLGRLALT